MKTGRDSQNHNVHRHFRKVTAAMLLVWFCAAAASAGGRLEDCTASDQPMAYPCQSGEWVKTYLELADGSVRVIEYQLINGEAVFEGDIILHIDERGYAQVAKEFDRLYNESSRGRLEKSLTKAITSFRWPNKVIYYKIDSEMAAADQQEVMSAINYWDTVTSLDFYERVSQNDYIFFTHCSARLLGLCIPATGCSSPAGRQGGKQTVTLAPACDLSNTYHEIGHAIGLWHEQSRSDRDHFVNIYWNNIISGNENQFRRLFDAGDFTGGNDGVDIGAYDYLSVMHYRHNAFGINGATTITRKNGSTNLRGFYPSSGDIAAVEYLYGSPSLLDFYEGNGGGQSLVCRLASGPTKMNIKDVDCPNDEARSLILRNVPAGLILRVYDDPACVASDDWTEIRVKQNSGSSYLISSFEQSFNNSKVQAIHHHNNGLDGKVSCLWSSQCGNGVCDTIESCSSCPADCGPCPYCGDGKCNGSETCYTCASDCGSCPTCNYNGFCEPWESSGTCSDCCDGEEIICLE